MRVPSVAVVVVGGSFVGIDLKSVVVKSVVVGFIVVGGFNGSEKILMLKVSMLRPGTANL